MHNEIYIRCEKTCKNVKKYINIRNKGTRRKHEIWKTRNSPNNYSDLQYGGDGEDCGCCRLVIARKLGQNGSHACAIRSKWRQIRVRKCMKKEIFCKCSNYELMSPQCATHKIYLRRRRQLPSFYLRSISSYIPLNPDEVMANTRSCRRIQFADSI